MSILLATIMGYLIDWYDEGSNTVCIYSTAMGEYRMVIPSHELCPQRMTFPGLT